MRIGLTGGASTVDKIIQQAVLAEADGFTSLWYASAVAGDPLAPIAVAGRATETIELGTAALQTYPCHPLLQANRATSTAAAMGRAGLTIGIGPSHEPVVRGVFGLSYDRPGRNTEEYVHILTSVLRGEDVDIDGEEWTAHTAARAAAPDHPIPVLLAALGPRLLRIAGAIAHGTICWMAPPRAIAEHVAPKLHAAASVAGRPSPRLVAGLPIAVHGDSSEARAAVAEQSRVYAGLANYERILDLGGATTAADAAIVGDEAAVEAGLQSLLDAGATDIWAQIVPVGDDRAARASSRQRTYGLLQRLAQS